MKTTFLLAILSSAVMTRSLSTRHTSEVSTLTSFLGTSDNCSRDDLTYISLSPQQQSTQNASQSISLMLLEIQRRFSRLRGGHIRLKFVIGQLLKTSIKCKQLSMASRNFQDQPMATSSCFCQVSARSTTQRMLYAI